MPDQTAVSCPHCGKSFRVADEFLGRRAKCKGCGEAFRLTAPVAAEPVDDGEYGLADDPMGGLAALGVGAAVEPGVGGGSLPPPPPMPGAAPAGKLTSAERFARATARQAAHRPVQAAAQRQAKAEAPWYAFITGTGARAVLGGAVVVLIIVLKIGWGVWAGFHDASTRNYGAPSGYNPSPPPFIAAPARTAPASPAMRPAAFDAPPAPPAPVGPPAPMRFHAEAGRRVGTATVTRRARRTEVKLVLPPGTHAPRSVPCVFVCPAGSTLLTGVAWGDGEREDFYPLLDRGVAVCFYSLDGTLDDPDTASEQQFAGAMVLYARAKGGASNLSDALDTVLADAPAIDPARLGAAGHSSAGTVALAGAAADRRIRAVAAMAPALDLPTRFGPEVMDDLPEGPARQLPFELSALRWSALPCPVFLVQAEDDDNVPASEAHALAAKFPGRVTLKPLPTGGHGGAYDQGLGPCFDWLAKQLGAAGR